MDHLFINSPAIWRAARAYASTALRRHHAGLAGALALGAAGLGAAAFGIAPLDQAAENLPHRLISQTVQAEAAEPQLEALAGLTMQLVRSDTTRAGDTADSLLRRLGVVDMQAAQWLTADPLSRPLFVGRAGKMVQVQTDAQGRLQSLLARYPAEGAERSGDATPTHFQRLSVLRGASGALGSTVELAALTSGLRLSSGTIRSSLFAATDEAGIPDAIAVQMAEIFSNDIDFRRDLRQGDHFSILSESLFADGEPISWNQGSGRILAAEFVNRGTAYDAVWFADGKGAYFDFNGQSKKRAFLSSPLEFSRVSSAFAMRFHPIEHAWRQHLGVDYAAPHGTPVRSIGNGVVVFAGRQNGYGNVIKLRHNGERDTVYAHLSRIGVGTGEKVEQGQIIGAVGATGWATGPHLHFEFLVRGQQVDPLVMAKTSESLTLTPGQQARFGVVAQQLHPLLALAATAQKGGAAANDHAAPQVAGYFE